MRTDFKDLEEELERGWTKYLKKHPQNDAVTIFVGRAGYAAGFILTAARQGRDIRARGLAWIGQAPEGIRFTTEEAVDFAIASYPGSYSGLN